MMNIKCDKCSTICNIPDSENSKQISIFKCPKCGNIITAQSINKNFASSTSCKICPKCGYERKETDSAPSYECPKCGIVYSKYIKNKIGDFINNDRNINSDVDVKNESQFIVNEKYKHRTYIKIVLFGLVAVFFFNIIYNFFVSPENYKDQSGSVYNDKSNATVTQKQNKSNWHIFESEDKMSGKKEVYAISPKVYSSPRMDFPYGDVSSFIGVGCNKTSTWVYFKFSTAPNLSNDTIKDGYDLIYARVKWDEQLENITLYQSWGSKSLLFWHNDSEFISKIASSKKVLLELKWHGEAPAYFEYSTEGAWDAIAKIREKCN